MGARSTHNRHRDSDFIDADINITIKKAKRYHAGEKEFYIFKALNMYYARANTLISKNPIKHFINMAKYGERSNWVEE